MSLPLALALAVALAAACTPPPPPLLLSACGADGVIALTWAAAAGADAGYIISLAPADAASAGSFGECSGARALRRTAAPDVLSARLAVATATRYNVSVAAASLECGAGAPAAWPGGGVTAVPVTLPTAGAALWLDARALAPPPPSGAGALLTSPAAATAGAWAFRPSHGDFQRTQIRLRAPRPGSSAPALVFGATGALAGDFFVPLGTGGATGVPSAADTAAFGWRAGADADNDLTLFAVFRSVTGAGGGFVVSKGGYPYFGDSGWNVVDSTYLGMTAMMTTGAVCKRCDEGGSRADLAINYTSHAEQAPLFGALLTFEFLRPSPSTSNTSMTLSACLGVASAAGGDVTDECSDSPGGGAAEWYPHVVEDQDVQPVGEASPNASWSADTPLMSQRVFALAAGGGFYNGGVSGNTRIAYGPFRGEIQSLAVFRRRLSGDERRVTQQFLADRYFTACAPLGTSTAWAGSCPSARNGRTCTLACPTGFALAGGATELFCANGAWAGLAPVCAASACAGAPPPIPAGADPASCTQVLAFEDFTRLSAGAVGALLFPSWETLPALPPLLAAQRWAPAVRTGGGLVGEAGGADGGTYAADACAFEEATALVLNRPRAAPNADLTAAVAVVASLKLDAGSRGGLLALVVAPSPSASDAWAATSFLRLTLVGGGATGTLEEVRNGSLMRATPFAMAAPADAGVALRVELRLRPDVGGVEVAVFVAGSGLLNTTVAALAGWPVVPRNASAGLHVASGRVVFASFAVRAACVNGSVCDPAALLPGQSCEYSCGSASGGGVAALSCAAGGGAALEATACGSGGANDSNSNMPLSDGPLIGTCIGAAVALTMAGVIVVRVQRVRAARGRGEGARAFVSAAASDDTQRGLLAFPPSLGAAYGSLRQ